MEQEQESVPYRGVALAAVVITAVSAVYVLLAWGLDSRGRLAMTNPWATIPEEVNEIEVAQFAEPTAAERAVAPIRERLGHYGWIDREAGLVHIPIDRAVEIYLARREAR